MLLGVGGKDAKKTNDVIGALAVGAAATAINRLVSYQGLTLTEVVLFFGGAILGAYGRSSLWALWLACALPWAPMTAIDLFDPASRARENLALLPVAIIFLAFTWGMTTSLFAVGFVAGRQSVGGSARGRSLLSQLGLPCAIGSVASFSILALAQSFGGQRVLDSQWPLLIVVILCLAWGAVARIAGRRETAGARVVSVAVGVNIGLAAWMSSPELSNLGPPFLGMLAIATAVCVAGGAKLASLWVRT